MAVPETLVLTAVKELTEAIYTPEGWTVNFDKLPRSTGHDAPEAALAVYPEAATPDPRHRVMLVIPCVLQVYLPYEARVDEGQQVDPTTIAGYADRLRRGFATGQGAGNSDLWYLRIDNITYPDDPTGNKTRFEAQITGRGDNTAELTA